MIAGARCCTLALVVGLSTALATPASADVVISVISATDGKGVQSRIWQRVGSNEFESVTDDQGKKTFEQISCGPRVAFKIKPYHPLYIYPTGWQVCQNKMVIKIQPVGYASSLEALLEAEPSKTAPLSSQDEKQRLASLETDFRTAADAGQWGGMAFYANEIAALLRWIGDRDVANLYSAIAIESGGRAISAARGASLFEPLLSHGPGQVLVESNAANDVLKEFQAEWALAPTGKWDFDTFVAIRKLDSQSIANTTEATPR